MSIKAIETQYKGYRFRSRLEARWAVFFDVMGIRWRYETEGFELANGVGRYLPDFYLPDWDMYVEVKPDLPSCEVTEEGVPWSVVFEGGRLTDMGKFILFSDELFQAQAAKEAGKSPPPWKSQCCMLCGTPGVPRLGQKDGFWELRDGAVALEKHLPGFISINAFAMAAGHELFDIKPYYLCGNIRKTGCAEPSQQEAAVYPQGSMISFYLGTGVSYDHHVLRKAYHTARSARFEYGETPQV